MPFYVALGASKTEVFEGCPFELEYLIKAQEIRDDMNDSRDWKLGRYIESAVATAIEHNFAGSKAKSQYIEKPFSQLKKERNKEKELTEEEKKQQVNLLFTSLKVMQFNFENEQRRKQGDKGHAEHNGASCN